MAKLTTARFNDYLYDPLFVVSGEKDYYKAAMAAKISSAKFAICPIFPSMFSDLPHEPRHQLIMRKTSPIPEYREHRKSDDSKYRQTRFQNKIEDNPFQYIHMPVLTPTLNAIPVSPTPSPSIRQKIPTAKKRNKKIQTQYRESSAQTSPWQPADYVVIDGSEPELLMLDFLKWGSGLPAGMHEIKLIERARMKRAWENDLPPVTDGASLDKSRQLIEAIERDEWAFREQEIQDIHDLRLELLEKMLNELHQKSKTRSENKMKMFCKLKLGEKEEKLKLVRHQAERELRKLNLKQRGVKTKYEKVNIVNEHADKKSELYGPLMRFGDNPKRWHQVIDEHIKKYRAQFLGVEEITTLPRWLDQATKYKDCACVKLPGTRLCIRETKWTTPVLKQLHEELKCLRKQDKHHCTLLRRVSKESSELLTPQVEASDEWEEELHQGTVLLQSVLRGRASQMLIFEGRDRCRELIQELRGTHALQEEDRIKKFYERLEVKSQQREFAVCLRNTTKLKETLNKLSGNLVGTMLDFLNKELRRLLEERRAHAMCLLFERERHAREAAEAGRRQKEIRRRLEHDEIFKQIVKVHQDTVDLYLQDIITEGMEFSSTEKARSYVENLAKKIDEEAYATLESSCNFQEKEEVIAGLVHNFLLPEVEKQLVRDKLKTRQRNHLQTVHDGIYNKIEDLPKPAPQSPGVGKTDTDRNIMTESPEHLLRSIRIGGFADLNLPETLPFGSEVNMLYSTTDDGDNLSTVCLEAQQFKDTPVARMKLSAASVDDNLAAYLTQETQLDLTALNL